MGLTWQEPADIAWALIDAHPGVDPLDLNFVDLHRMIVAGGFGAADSAEYMRLFDFDRGQVT